MLDVVEFVFAVITVLLFLWWLLRTLFLAFRTGIMLMVRPPYVATPTHRPFAFWVMAFTYTLLAAMSLFMLFLLLVVPFIH